MADELIHLDPRRRTTVRPGRHDTYLVTEEPDGTLIWRPAAVVTEDEAALASAPWLLSRIAANRSRSDRTRRVLPEQKKVKKLLDPDYGEGVSTALDRVEFDEGRQGLWRSIVETLHFICTNPDSPPARRYAIRTPDGRSVWRVPIPASGETENWSLLWEPDGEDALIHYVGVWPPPTEAPKD